MSVLTTQDIQNAVDLNLKHRGAYFWRPISTASARRDYERRNALKIDGIYKGHSVQVDMTVKCSCTYTKLYQRIVVDGKLTTITKLKNLIKKEV